MAIIQSGIQNIVVESFIVPVRWLGDMVVACEMLYEAGVKVRIVDGVPQEKVVAITQDVCINCGDLSCKQPSTGYCPTTGVA